MPSNRDICKLEAIINVILVLILDINIQDRISAGGGYK
jgi:hypothetical protein